MVNLKEFLPVKPYRTKFTKTVVLNFLVGLIIFFVMGLKHTSIGFHADDYGITYNGTFNTLSDVERIIKNGDLIIEANQPHDEPRTPRLSFLEVIYRPLLLIVMGLERKVCGLNPYHFHLIHTTFHTINSLAILNVVAWYTHPLAGAVCSLFFGLHTSLKDYFFLQCYIQNSLQTTLLLLLLCCLFMWLHKKRHLVLGLGFLIFSIALFLRETLLFFPAIPLATLLIFRTERKTLFKKIILTCGYFSIPIAAYLGMRLWAYPFSSEAKSLGIKSIASTTQSAVEIVRGKFFDVLTCGFDILGLKWIPANSGLAPLKLGILLGIGVTSWWLWKRNPYKKLLLLSVVATIILSWPAWLLVHCSRYIYPAILSVSIGIGLLSKPLFMDESPKIWRYTFATFGLFSATLQGFITNTFMNHHVESSRTEMACIKSLAAHMKENKNVLILNYPEAYLSVGHRPGLKLYGVKDTAMYHINPLKPFSKAIRWDDTTNKFIEVTP